jgi:putative membrane protein
MLTPVLKKNDRQARLLIWIVSFVVFGAVTFLTNFKPLTGLSLGFNVHLLALCNAVINATVSILLVWALVAVKNKKYELHKRLMLVAIVLSALFLITYIGHHLLASETKFGGPHNTFYYFYLFILITHIFLATIILPFILFTAYRSLTGEYEKHKKLAKYTWPLWLYVSITGVLVYLLISPYYVPHIKLVLLVY